MYEYSQNNSNKNYDKVYVEVHCYHTEMYHGVYYIPD
jgi:hypothetical protein